MNAVSVFHYVIDKKVSYSFRTTFYCVISVSRNLPLLKIDKSYKYKS